jgi:DNA-binding SARP family transcriptional activator
MESARPDRVRGLPSIEVRMLGPLTIRREGVTLPLPASRKVRGLLAYLSLSPRAVARSQLCELLWDVPNDPRGELRWSLSKIRGLIDANGQPETTELAGCVGGAPPGAVAHVSVQQAR